MLSGLTGFFGSKPQKPQNPNAELNRISIEIAKSGKVVAKGSGHYSSFFEIDGKVYWRFNDAYPLWNMTAEGLTHKLPAETATLKQLIKDKKWEQAEAYLCPNSACCSKSGRRTKPLKNPRQIPYPVYMFNYPVCILSS